MLELRFQFQEGSWFVKRVIQGEATSPAGPLPGSIQVPLLEVQAHIRVSEVWTILLQQLLK